MYAPFREGFDAARAPRALTWRFMSLETEIMRQYAPSNQLALDSFSCKHISYVQWRFVSLLYSRFSRFCLTIVASAAHPRENMRKDKENTVRRVAKSRKSYIRAYTPTQMTRLQRKTPPLGSSSRASDISLRQGDEVLTAVKIFM